MQEKLSKDLAGLTLGNLNHKLQGLRDKLKNDISEDLEYMHFKMTQENHSQHQSNNYSMKHSLGSASNNSRNTNNQGRNYELNDRISREISVKRSTPADSYLNLELETKKVDFQQIKALRAKKISEDRWSEYIRSILNLQLKEKIKEIYDQIVETDDKVETELLVKKIGKLGVKFSQGKTIQIPILQRYITLKKILFELWYKAQKLPQRINWFSLLQQIQQYRHPQQPMIDQYMQKEAASKPKAKNFFNIQRDIISELKTILKRCQSQKFLGYYPLRSLINGLQHSRIIQSNLQKAVRPKSNYEVQITLQQTIKYISIHSPQFIDGDQFLLFFTVKGFTYYPIQQRYGQIIDEQQNNNKMKKVKSDRKIMNNNHHQKKTYFFDEYYLSTNKPNTIRKAKLQEMLLEKKEQQEKQKNTKFKARELPKSISKQKYEQFMKSFQQKLEKAKREMQADKIHSERQLMRLKSQTKLFVSPKKQNVIIQKPKFTARPAPQFVKQPLLNVKKQVDTQRRKKIMSQTQIKYQQSWQKLPFVATMDTKKQFKQQPKQSYKIQINPIPNYIQQQTRIQQELQRKKRQFQPTQPEQFQFHTAKRHPQHKIKTHLQYEVSQDQQSYDFRQLLYETHPQVYYTTKFKQMTQAVQKKAKERQLSLQKKKVEQEQILRKHENFAKFMKPNLKKLPDTAKICENEAKMKIERHKKYWKKLDREYEEDLNDIYGNILKRPFLYELQSVKSERKLHVPQQSIQKPKTKKKAPKKPKKQPQSSDYQMNKSF